MNLYFKLLKAFKIIGGLVSSKRDERKEISDTE